MKSNAIIFDLDNTIFHTEDCKPYLRTSIGRSVIVGLIKNERIALREMYPGIVGFINSLIEQGISVYILSDSPIDYCIETLGKGGVRIDSRNVFGSQHKPTVEYNSIFEWYDNVLVVGDNAKDVYFAHMNSYASILLAKLNDTSKRSYSRWSKPGAICTNLQELSSAISTFMSGGFIRYNSSDFKGMYLTIDSQNSSITEIAENNIGHAFEYWPNSDDWNGVEERKKIWFDVKRSIKVAKELTRKQIENNDRVTFYNKNDTIGYGNSFKVIMWVYFQEFKKWANSKGLKGRVYLVPTPPSVPMECNKSFPMLILAEWWAKYAYHAHKNGEIQFTLETLYAVERYWPTLPAHMSNGRREVRPHLDTLGVYRGSNKRDAFAAIIIDDIVTSGTQMNAVATMLVETGVLLKTVPLYGYALARTTRPGADVSELLRLFSASEKAGA